MNDDDDAMEESKIEQPPDDERAIVIQNKLPPSLSNKQVNAYKGYISNRSSKNGNSSGVKGVHVSPMKGGKRSTT